MKSFSDYIVPKARDEPTNVIKGRFEVKETDEEKQLAFGWANVAIRADGEQIEDWQGDMIDIDELEQAVYNYVELYRDGGEMHERGGVAVLVESMVFTKEKLKYLGLSENALPDGWWVGFKVNDKDVWEKVKDGTYEMFSIEGTAVREEVESPDGTE
ncbi:hypothetical protein FMM68_03970 [Lachnospiraceae bacterium MD329]|nr:hypothetical protein [Lachnospiraceae bacterium MD329]